MKQTNELSTLVAGMVSEVVTGVMTGVTSARRRHYRNLLLVAIVVMGVTFAITFMYLNNSLDVSVPQAHDEISAPASKPAKGGRPEPTPRGRKDAEVLRRQIHREEL